jgi:hypothetical protein
MQGGSAGWGSHPHSDQPAAAGPSSSQASDRDGQRPKAGLAPAGLSDLSQSMSLAALAMLAVFVLSLLSSVLPSQLADPAWQLGFVTVLVDNAVVALVALLTLHVAARLNARDGFSASLRDGAARWAIAASLGFLLLVPLQLWNGWRLQQADSRSLARQERQVELRFQQLRRAVAEAASVAELQQGLRQVVGSPLPPLNPSEPLPQLKAQLNGILRRNERRLTGELQRQRQSRAEARGGGGLIPTPLRGALSCLAYALAFAALARRPQRHIGLLAELVFTVLPRLGHARGQNGTNSLGSPDEELREEELVP